MAIYETIFILDSLLSPKEIDAAIERFSGIITENGGTIRKVDKWGKKRLAYEIQKKQYGFYAAIEFEGKGNIPKALESEYNFNDNVMRYLTYRYDKHKLKAMEQQEKEAAEKKAAAAPAPAPETAPAQPAAPAEEAKTAEPSPEQTEKKEGEE